MKTPPVFTRTLSAIFPQTHIHYKQKYHLPPTGFLLSYPVIKVIFY